MVEITPTAHCTVCSNVLVTVQLKKETNQETKLQNVVIHVLRTVQSLNICYLSHPENPNSLAGVMSATLWLLAGHQASQPRMPANPACQPHQPQNHQ